MSSQTKKNKAPKRVRTRGTRTSSAASAMERRIPSAISTVRRNATELMFSSIQHPTEGAGVRISGSQQLAAVTTASTTDLTFFTATTPATQFNSNIIFLSPDTLNGRLAAFAGLYAKYVFRRVEFEYRPVVATTQAGGGVLAYVRDPQITGSVAAPTYTTAQELEYSVTFPFREPARLVMEYKGNSVYFTELDATSQASYRQTCQGVIFGYPSAGSLGAVNQGFVHIHYIIDLFATTPTQAIVGLSGLERDFLRKELLKFRASQKDSKERDSAGGSDMEYVLTPGTPLKRR